MNQKIKISQLPAKGSNLAADDLLEVAEFTGTGYVSKSITGQEIIDSVPATTVEWGDIGGTLSDQTDLQTALNAKQDTLVSGTNIKTINGTSVLGSGDISISTGLTIGTTAIASGTVGRVLFEGTGNVVSESANLFWDNTNGRLGIGTSIPTTNLHIVGSGDILLIDSVSSNTRATLKLTAASSSYTQLVGNGTEFNMVTLGTTPLTFGTNSAERLRIHGSTGNIGVNTTTDAGFKLDVNGTARVQNVFTVTKGGNNYFTFDANANGSNPFIKGFYSGAVDVRLNFSNPVSFTDGGSGAFLDFKAGSITGTALTADGGSSQGSVLVKGGSTQNSGVFFWESGVAFRGVIGFAAGSADFQIRTGLSGQTSWSGSERMRIFGATGNVGINTTTDAGFRLDVNGTARVQGNLTQTGANTAALGYITNGTLGVYSNTPTASLIGILVGCVSNTGHTAIFTKGNNANSTAIRVTDQNVGASVNHFMVDYLGATGFGIANGTLQVNASAQVEIQSTTKGFLPPRMTTTQKNAISTPATGLQVFDTTLNQMSYYNGTTWINL